MRNHAGNACSSAPNATRKHRTKKDTVTAPPAMHVATNTATIIGGTETKPLHPEMGVGAFSCPKKSARRFL
jgi:hypothetical protein